MKTEFMMLVFQTTWKFLIFQRLVKQKPNRPGGNEHEVGGFMGEHRASIKIEMEFHGVKDTCDMWINYMGDQSFCECEGVDDRVVKFVRSVYERGMVKYEEAMEKYWEEQHAK